MHKRTHALALAAAILRAALAPAAIAAQEPPEPAPDADTMVIRGIAPVPPGSVIRVEALDPVTIRGVECVRANSEADAAVPDGSRFMLVVHRSCFENLAANLRICWGPDDCVGFEFAPGETVDLGDLNTRRAAQASQVIFPDAGARAASSHLLDDTLAKQLTGLGAALVVLGLLSMFGYGRITPRAR
jgi:hypothetical protein